MIEKLIHTPEGELKSTRKRFKINTPGVRRHGITGTEQTDGECPRHRVSRNEWIHFVPDKEYEEQFEEYERNGAYCYHIVRSQLIEI